MEPRVLYAGDGNVGEAANYLLAVLRHLKAEVTYVPSGGPLTEDVLRPQDVLIFSDYGRGHLTAAAEAACVAHIRSGRGFLMIGGWGSFSAKYGMWHRSPVARWLPVACLGVDDRTNLSSGALIVPRKAHALSLGLDWRRAPVVCGLNRTRMKPQGELLWEARALKPRVKGRVRVELSRSAFPLLAVRREPSLRVAAFTTDVAPHWCGGLVDWGGRRMTLPVNAVLRVEVGDQYVRFLGGLIRWLAGRSPRGAGNTKK